MREYTSYLTVAGICLLILTILLLRDKMAFAFRTLCRGIFGTVCIAITNKVLAFLGIGTFIGVNPITVLTSAILGIPGICALYLMLIL
ncbi:MAG: pro-sigmaK processing inhibitor BofA family protein [Lachnospiraceae bacterium]|nr:pro-sigmaK processing inhibitor BofA family protein [Lachnospiraceae bacterium]